MFNEIVEKIKKKASGAFARDEFEMIDDAPKVEPEPKVEVFFPETKEDLVWLLKRLPSRVLTADEKARIAAVMTFSTRRVGEVMLRRDEIPFVQENEFLGPLTLDKLYKSGFSHFPVVGRDGRISGVIHTDSLNSLEIREMDRASHYLDPKVLYVREDYTLEQAMAAFIRTNCYFFMVINRTGHVVGMLTYQMVAEQLLGKLPEDDFVGDAEIGAVVRRQL